MRNIIKQLKTFTMKNQITKTLIIITLITQCISVNLNAAYPKTTLNEASFSYALSYKPIITDDPNLVLLAIKDGSEVSLQVSFDGNEGNSGSISIFSGNTELIHEMSISIAHSPGFTAVNLSEYAAGTYTCQLKTASGIHVSHFTIN